MKAKLSGLVLAGFACSALAVGPAYAADVGATSPTIVPTTIAAAPEVGFAWDRFFVGVQGGAWFEFPPLSYDSLRFAVIAGRNWTVADRVVLGVEGTVGFYDPTDPYLELYAYARAGVLATDNLFLYTLAGIGLETDLPLDPDYALMLGVGAEFAVTDRLSLRADALFWREFGDVFDYLSLTGGLSWYLGR